MNKSVALLGILLVSALLFSCGGGDSKIRTVLVDYRDDDFASSFTSYFPRDVVVHQGDTIRFKQTWTGEPHSVTMGSVVDDMFKFSEIFEQYDSEEDARAGGVSEETLDQITETFTHIPGMTGEGGEIYQPGAKPCYVAKVADLPLYSDRDDNILNGPETACPADGKRQPAFDGRQALYNSGYIPWQGTGANEFVVPIAADAKLGKYTYFCNYHWTAMSGTVTIAPPSKDIASNGEISRLARKEIVRDAKKPAAAVRKAIGKYASRPTTPLAGVDAGRPYSEHYVSANEFFPAKIRVKAGQPVTWSFDGLSHTISFNVPGYFPVFTIAKNGDVDYDKRAQEAVRWMVPKREIDDEDNSPPRKVDVGEWDGGGGFHSSGLLNEGDTFTVTFTKPGTYPYACVVHPPMIGQIVVS
jgi:plastocyanin